LTSLVAGDDAATADQSLLRLLQFEPDKLTRSQVLTLLHLFQELRRTAPDVVANRKHAIVEASESIPRFDSADEPLPQSARLRHELARLLVDLQAATGMERAAALLTGSLQEDRLMGLLLLRSVKEGWTPATRRQYFAALNEASNLVGGDGMPKFLATLRDESLATLSEKERQELARILQPQVERESDLALPARPVIQAWTLEDLLPLVTDSSHRSESARSAAVTRGAAVFRDALCSRCHRVGAVGPAVGPDLTHVAGRFGRRDLLQSMLTPAAVVAENYRNVQVLLKDGRSLVGRIFVEGDFRSETMRLATDPLKPSEFVEINKRDIERTKLTETSPMPAHLLDTFNEQAILDLLAFLEAGARTPPQAK
jgi:putative heme-binding domain-containing protein